MKKPAEPTNRKKATPPKRGRPPGGNNLAVRRFNTRFPDGLVEKMELAASLRGMPVSAFIQEAVAERAERILMEETRWWLGRDEAGMIAALIVRPPKPNKAMLEAAERAAGNVVIRS